MTLTSFPFRCLRVLAWLRARGSVDVIALASLPFSTFLIGMTVALSGRWIP